MSLGQPVGPLARLLIGSLGLMAVAVAAAAGVLALERPAPVPAAPLEAIVPPPPKVIALPVPRRPPPPAPFRALSGDLQADLVETTEDGLRLPKVAADGWLPWIAYSRRFEAPRNAPRVGILMINLGADPGLTERAVDELPGEVSLAFLPGSPDLPRWLQRAHDKGHETYLMLPLEDQAIPAERGVRPVQPGLDPAENVRRLRAAMARGEGYVGFVLVPGLPAWPGDRALRPIVQELAERGLGVVEVNPVGASPTVQRLAEQLAIGYARTAEVLDYKLAEGGIAASLDRLDAWASEGKGAAQGEPDQPPRHRFGVVQPDSEAIDTIAAWIRGRPKQPAASLVPVIGHFECREPCMARLRAQPAQLQP